MENGLIEDVKVDKSGVDFARKTRKPRMHLGRLFPPPPPQSTKMHYDGAGKSAINSRVFGPRRKSHEERKRTRVGEEL